MRTTPFIPLGLAATCLMTLASCGTDTHTNEAHHGPNSLSQETSPDTAVNDVVSAAAADRTGVWMLDANEVHVMGSKPGTPVYDERYAASKSIRGYRALLITELETIRKRLNDGTRSDEITKIDQQRAADLAQGLERMDRLIQAVEASDDMTWSTIRESRMKEAAEVRAWANEHGYRPAS